MNQRLLVLQVVKFLLSFDDQWFIKGRRNGCAFECAGIEGKSKWGHVHFYKTTACLSECSVYYSPTVWEKYARYIFKVLCSVFRPNFCIAYDASPRIPGESPSTQSLKSQLATVTLLCPLTCKFLITLFFLGLYLFFLWPNSINGLKCKSTINFWKAFLTQCFKLILLLLLCMHKSSRSSKKN